MKFTLPTLSSLPSLHLAYDYVAAGKWKVKLNDPSRQSENVHRFSGAAATDTRSGRIYNKPPILKIALKVL